jgi:Zn-dependent protease
MPAVLMLTTGFVFGGAKPVPVNFYNLRRPYRDMALVAMAGPLSNLLIALVLAFVLKAMYTFGGWNRDSLGFLVLQGGVYLNLLLAVFNMLPIPPLDGSRIMAWLLPESLRAAYGRLESIGIVLVMALMFMGVLSGPIFHGMYFLEGLLNSIVSLGGLW